MLSWVLQIINILTLFGGNYLFCWAQYNLVLFVFISTKYHDLKRWRLIIVKEKDEDTHRKIS